MLTPHSYSVHTHKTHDNYFHSLTIILASIPFQISIQSTVQVKKLNTFSYSSPLYIPVLRMYPTLRAWQHPYSNDIPYKHFLVVLLETQITASQAIG
jgi:hypothetical protein